MKFAGLSSILIPQFDPHRGKGRAHPRSIASCVGSGHRSTRVARMLSASRCGRSWSDSTNASTVSARSTIVVALRSNRRGVGPAGPDLLSRGLGAGSLSRALDAPADLAGRDGGAVPGAGQPPRTRLAELPPRGVS